MRRRRRWMMKVEEEGGGWGGRTERDGCGGENREGASEGGGGDRLRRRRNRKKRRKEHQQQDTHTHTHTHTEGRTVGGSRSLRRRIWAAAAGHRSSRPGRRHGAMATEDSRSTACTGSSLLQPVSEITNLPLDQVRSIGTRAGASGRRPAAARHTHRAKCDTLGPRGQQTPCDESGADRRWSERCSGRRSNMDGGLESDTQQTETAAIYTDRGRWRSTISVCVCVCVCVCLIWNSQPVDRITVLKMNSSCINQYEINTSIHQLTAESNESDCTAVLVLHESDCTAVLVPHESE